MIRVYESKRLTAGGFAAVIQPSVATSGDEIADAAYTHFDASPLQAQPIPSESAREDSTEDKERTSIFVLRASSETVQLR